MVRGNVVQQTHRQQQQRMYLCKMAAALHLQLAGPGTQGWPIWHLTYFSPRFLEAPGPPSTSSTPMRSHSRSRSLRPSSSNSSACPQGGPPGRPGSHQCERP